MEPELDPLLQLQGESIAVQAVVRNLAAAIAQLVPDPATWAQGMLDGLNARTQTAATASTADAAAPVVFDVLMRTYIQLLRPAPEQAYPAPTHPFAHLAEQVDRLTGQVTALRTLVNHLVQDRVKREPDPEAWTQGVLQHLLPALARTEKQVGLAPQQVRMVDATADVIIHALRSPAVWA